MALQRNGNHCKNSKPVVCDPKVIVEDVYVPEIVPVVHPVEIVQRIHCVPVPVHHVVVCKRVEYCGFDR
ncbi:spore coat protein D [Paenibacillus shirakamiensis]|uniref:Spore coat protein D n=1 Tax=Paenibacillus shirakamiensis TaxID=1265935 RepID=A0ABS4JGR5_9BACL|nr:hypothetical protein [Paenibacillus shirakamiensis]MBP2000913.1 spore coat protein D [Paenibacillus shirakamiensis]